MRQHRMLLPTAVFAVALGVAAFTFFDRDEVPLVDTSDVNSNANADADADSSASGNEEPTGEQQPSRELLDPIRVDDPAMAIGDADAPLVMVTFESFGCLWCGNFHRLTLPGIYDKYVDTGLLRIEARMMPYEERALPGALVGTAAGMQNRYWELAEVLYPFISGDGEPPFERDLSAEELGTYRERQTEAGLLAEVERYADQIDLDYEQFLADYRSPEAQQRVATDTEIGYAIGFTGTPAAVVNGVPLGGFVGYESFDEFLTSVLEASATPTGAATSTTDD
jgi:protein-disulfide isomerase